MPFLRKYGVAIAAATAYSIRIPVIKRGVVDYALAADWTPAAGDVTIQKDGGAAANIATLPTAITAGNGAVWEFTFSATEMQAARIVVTVVDSATKAVEDQAFVIETYGNASAMYPPDFSNATNLGLADLDAAVSSRSTYAGADTPGTTTLLGRLTQAILFDAAGNVKSDMEQWIGVTMNVLTSGNVQCTVAGYASGQDPATLIKAATLSATPTAGTIESKLQMIGADEYTDETTDPTQWHVVYVVAGSGAPGTGYTLATKKLWDTAGAKVAANNQVIGQVSQ